MAEYQKEYQVFSRKYRPTSFKEVIGQEIIVKIISAALAHNRVGHAYLFCGPHGTGKTTLARLFAKALNCKSLQNGEPCNLCTSCKEIGVSASLDVLEIDGASHRGIEDIRTLNESLGYIPAHGNYRIYLIDEVHMLTKEAFNALLKSLEEPPPHAKFFLATTEPNMVPLTIVSRCQKLNFKRISKEKIVYKLERIASDLQRKVDPSALALLSHYAEGGLRDAESLFEELLLFQEETISLETVQEFFGLVPKQLFLMLDEAVVASDFKQAFVLIDLLFREGKNLLYFIEELTLHFRAHLLLLVEKKEQGPYTIAQCLGILEMLSQAPQEMQKSPSKRIYLEILLLKIVNSHKKIALETLVERLEKIEKGAIEDKRPTIAEQAVPLEIEKKAEVGAEAVEEKVRHETLMRFAAKELNGLLEGL